MSFYRQIKQIADFLLRRRGYNLLRPTTKFTCCARCGAVAPRVLGPTRQKIADKAQAGRLFCALPRGASGTIGDAKWPYRLN
ncbi:hypothetical protein Turpa_3332 [Turneriella parva DSM 21527]|uniref:Uncharacterized protein n=1 Tax=Turneriella parva (strain ATCC BAA-1111 / DSM 21527 / NCTC 11395 / H) TaxID=869212 RepID=I4B9L3_TURPD|nr:hypothetical protein Turpa_3332 [Turneriella parva DSM 21527]